MEKVIVRSGRHSDRTNGSQYVHTFMGVAVGHCMAPQTMAHSFGGIGFWRFDVSYRYSIVKCNSCATDSIHIIFIYIQRNEKPVTSSRLVCCVCECHHNQNNAQILQRGWRNGSEDRCSWAPPHDVTTWLRLANKVCVGFGNC